MTSDSKTIIFGNKTYREKGRLFVTSNDFTNPPEDYESTMIGINQMKKIQNSLINGKPITHLFSYKNISMWWLFFPEISIKIIHITNYIKNVNKFLEKEKPTLVKMEDDFTFYKIVKQICNKQQIPFEYSKLNLLKFQKIQKIKLKIREKKAKILLTKKIQNRKNLFKNANKIIPKLDDSIIFVSYPIYRRDIFDAQKNISQKGEFIIQDLINLLDEKEKIIGIDIFSLISSNDKILEERISSELNWIPIEILMKSKSKDENEKNFLKNYESIINSNDFQKFFKFMDIDYWTQINPEFQKMKFVYYLPFWIHIFDSLLDYLKLEKPKTIFLIYETGPISLIFIQVCEILGIKTIGIQHGIIYESQHYHMHDKFANSDNPFEFPLPNKLLLFGEITKKILLKLGYPEEKLEVFGHPAFFNLPKFKSKLNPKSLLKKYDLPDNSNIILFVPPGLRYYRDHKINYNKEILVELLKNFEKKKNFYIIIKPHPADKIDWYENILKNFKIPNSKVIQGDLLELISLSSLVVSTISTSIIDSMSLNVPVIQVKTDNVDFQTLFDGFNALKQTSLSNLTTTIESLIEDNETKNLLLKNGALFVKQYYNFPSENHKQFLNNLLK